jgi:hypothetical protein
LWWLFDEPLGVREVSGVQNDAALFTDGLGVAVVDVGGGV